MNEENKVIVDVAAGTGTVAAGELTIADAD